ncbi:18810_t:CDS:2, partial [Racocetra persica]
MKILEIIVNMTIILSEITTRKTVDLLHESEHIANDKYRKRTYLWVEKY